MAISSTHSVILRSVLCDVRISSTHSVILRSALCDVRISSLKSIYEEKKPKKMRSSRGKAPLRMTPVVSDEVLTPSKSEGSG
jgi:hypothetical protein